MRASAFDKWDKNRCVLVVILKQNEFPFFNGCMYESLHADKKNLTVKLFNSSYVQFVRQQ